MIPVAAGYGLGVRYRIGRPEAKCTGADLIATALPEAARAPHGQAS